MEPSAAATCNGYKRKNFGPITQEKSKRLKTAHGRDVTLERDHLCGSPRISVLHHHLQQPVTLTEVTELLHYAALGKTGGIKQPR